MRIIPGKTKVRIEIFKGLSVIDLVIGFIAGLFLVFILVSTLPVKIVFVGFVLFVTIFLLIRIDEEPNYIYLLNILRHIGYPKHFSNLDSSEYLIKKAQSAKDANIDEIFPEKEEEPVITESKEERAARLKAEKEEYKRDTKLLKSKKLTKEEEDAIWLKRANQAAKKKEEKHTESKKNAASKNSMESLFAVTGIADGFLEYGGEYFGRVIEIPPVNFKFFSDFRRANSIENGLGAVIRSADPDYGVNIVKLERPVAYSSYIKNEAKKLEQLRKTYESGFLTEEELKIRVEVLYDRINDLLHMENNNKTLSPYYYLVFFGRNKTRLDNTVFEALNTLKTGEMEPHLVKDDAELALFIKYSNEIDFDAKEIEKIAPEDYLAWVMPKTIDIKHRTVEINDVVTHNLRLVKYPVIVNDAWLARVMSMPATKVVVKAKVMDKEKTIRSIDKSLSELRAKLNNAKSDSEAVDAQTNIETLSELLAMLQNENESLYMTNIYVTAYDIVASANLYPENEDIRNSTLAYIAEFKKFLRRTYQEAGFKLNNMEFNQFKAFVGSQISAYDPMEKDGRGIPSNTLAACYPWIYAHPMDDDGITLGQEDGVPVFIDFFKRNSERVNSNMVIVGKSGAGKSFATKSLLTNLAADNSKIFILDPENEYQQLAKNLHGKYINVGNASFGRLNPFHVITALEDDEAAGELSSSYSTHLQFLEEFFKQILPDCDKDSMEYLNSLVDRIYAKKGINAASDFSRLRPEDYPVFDDLYDEILREFQRTDNEYIRTMLRTLMNYVSKFASGGRNSQLWNGPSSITTDENFTVFGFQSLLANRNATVSNAQMLLVLKYIDNEIIKNREYNLKYGTKRKVVVVIDEAHVFIDTKFPVALDFMFQLAKRIRKYNGMQIVITQNIKDFVGSEEIARKSTAIINACQYSFILALSPNDMGDLCTLYEKAGGINENEQEQIVQAARGEVFTILSPSSRSSFKIEVPDGIREVFKSQDFHSAYFEGEDGAEAWEEYMKDSRDIRAANVKDRPNTEVESGEAKVKVSKVTLVRKTKADADAQATQDTRAAEIPAEPVDAFDDWNAQLKTEAALDVAASKIDAQPPEYQPVPVYAPQSSKTEEILAGLVGQLSREAMAEEIRKILREENISSAVGSAGSSAFDDVFGSTDGWTDNDWFSAGDTSKSSVSDSFIDVFTDTDDTTADNGAMPDLQSFVQNFAAEPQAEPVPEQEVQVAKFSIMDYMNDKVETAPAQETEIVLFTGDEQTAEINIETLIAYNKQQLFK